MNRREFAGALGVAATVAAMPLMAGSPAVHSHVVCVNVGEREAEMYIANLQEMMRAETVQARWRNQA